MIKHTGGDRLRYANALCPRFADRERSGPFAAAAREANTCDERIASLSRFLGCYDVWLQLRQKYNLKWSTGNEALDTFERFFDDSKTFDTMLQWVRQVRQEAPKSYSDFFMFCTLTGLRASECINSIRLIKDPEQFKTYYNDTRAALEHFRFPKVFICRIKAAYISLVNDEILDIARNGAGSHKYYAVRLMLEREKISMEMNYCRKIFASHLRQSGIESEIVDLL
jgi:hypothetical protein